MQPSSPPVHAADCQVVELRQYTLHPGRRDALVALFDREFVETQEAAGIRVLGQFRDLDRPDHFVWLRGFPDMKSRREALQAFYDGPVWAAHRDAANATMVDSDDVLLLRPAWPGAGLQVRLARPAVADSRPAAGVLDATVFHLRAPADEALAELSRITRVLVEGGATAVGWYVTEPGPNTFPRLPVREGEPVLVVLALFPDLARHEAFAASGRWARDAVPALRPFLARPPQALRLAPTSRSAIRT